MFHEPSENQFEMKSPKHGLEKKTPFVALHFLSTGTDS